MRTRAERNIRRVGGNRRRAAGGVVERVVMSPGTLIDDGLDLPLPPMARRAAGEIIDRVDKLAESDQWKIEFDMPYAGTSPEKMGFPAFTLGQEWSQGERYDILQRCHQVWERNPICKAMVAYTTMFVTGNGLQVSYRSKEVQEVVEAFLKESNIPRREKEVCQGLVVDGEVFVRYHLAGNGKSRVSFIAPWNVISVETDPDDFETLVTYTIRSPDGTEEKPIPADEVEHVAINRMAYELRGRPDILPSLPWLKAARDWLEDKFRAVRRQASILYDVTLKGATPAQVKSRVAQLKQPPSPGSVVVHNDAEVWNLLSAPGPAAGDIEIGRALRIMAIVGVLMPDFMFSDGANANLAVATAQAYPPLKRFEYYQDTLEEYWMTIIRRVVSWAVEKGIIDEMVAEVDADGDPVFDAEADGKGQSAKIGEEGSVQSSDKKRPRMVKAIDAVSASYPSLDSNDILKLTQALTAQVAQGWTSNETAMHELGRDPMIEKKRIEAEKAEGESEEKISQADQLAAQMAQQPEVPGEQAVPAALPVKQPGGQVAGAQGQPAAKAQGVGVPPAGKMVQAGESAVPFPVDGEKLTEFNPYHVPAGSSEGGQFATADGGGDGESNLSSPGSAGEFNSAWNELEDVDYRPSDKALLVCKEHVLQNAEWDEIDQAMTNLESAVANKPVSVRMTDTGAEGLLRDGRFKTQFETGTSSGMFEPDFRMECEERGMGVPRRLSTDRRPIYGYISTGNETVNGYGAFEMVLKQNIRSRTTITVGDSLGDFSQGHTVAAPLNHPTMHVLDTGVKGAINKNWGSYIEAQIHGGLTLKDVSHVVIHQTHQKYPMFEWEKNWRRMVAKFEEAGLEVVRADD